MGFTIQKGATPASTGYASVALSGTVVGRISIGDWYDAGVTAGASGITLSDSWGGASDYHTTYTVSASAPSTEQKSQSLYVTSGSWSSGSCPIYLRSGSSSGTIRARSSVSMPTVGEATWSWSYPQQGYIQASVTIGGKTYSDAKQY